MLLIARRTHTHASAAATMLTFCVANESSLERCTRVAAASSLSVSGHQGDPFRRQDVRTEWGAARGAGSRRRTRSPGSRGDHIHQFTCRLSLAGTRCHNRRPFFPSASSAMHLRCHLPSTLLPLSPSLASLLKIFSLQRKLEIELRIRICRRLCASFPRTTKDGDERQRGREEVLLRRPTRREPFLAQTLINT